MWLKFTGGIAVSTFKNKISGKGPGSKGFEITSMSGGLL